MRISLVDRLNPEMFTALGDDGEPEWMLEFAKRESSRAITEKRKELEERLAKTRLEEEKKQRSAIESRERPRKKQVVLETLA